MTKLNLDQIVQQKLGELDIKYKAEYWNDMEEKLNSSSSSLNTNLGASSGISSTYLIAIATIGIAALSVITFMLLNRNKNEISSDLIGDKVLIENIQPVNNLETTDTKAIIEVKKSDKYVESTKISKNNSTNHTKTTSKVGSSSTYGTSVVKSKINNIETEVNSDNTVEAKPIIKTDSDANIVKATNSDALNNTTNDKLAEPTENNEKYTGEAIIVNSDSCNGSSYIKKTSYHKEGKESNGKDKIKKNNNLKNVTPINKPAKRVFKKRKGGLWGLISRR